MFAVLPLRTSVLCMFTAKDEAVEVVVFILILAITPSFKRKKTNLTLIFKMKICVNVCSSEYFLTENYLSDSSLFCSSSQASNQALALPGADHVTGGLHIFLLLLPLQTS